MAIGVQPAPSGMLGAVKTYDVEKMRRQFVPDHVAGHYRPERRHLLLENQPSGPPLQQRVLAFLRDHVHAGLPRAWYKLVLGHDLHVSVSARLFVQHWHATQRDPFDPSRIGWTENIGLVSSGKVTTAFRDFQALMLVTDATTMGDFKFHRVGTDNTAESNAQTALIADAGLEATGNQTNPTASQYQSVATITADASETWAEHSIRNATGATGGTMLDRSLISPTVSVVASDNVTFTYLLQLNAES